MCGRTLLPLAPDVIQQTLESSNLNCTKWVDKEKYKSSYNVAPTYYEPVVRTESESNEQIIHSMKWGLVPSWTKDKSKSPTSTQSINCRDDSLYEISGKPMFKSLKNKSRCIIVAQGFYEWSRERKKKKTPYLIKRKDENLLLLAGLYDKAQLENDDTLYTYTIITTSSSNFLSFLHDRMPVILENDSDCLTKWLDPNIRWCSEFEELLKPYEGELECYPVSQDVGNVSNDYPSLINPITKTNITTFFSGKKDKAKDTDVSSSKPVIKQDDDDDIKESTSKVSIPAKRSLDDLKDDMKDYMKDDDIKDDIQDDDIKDEFPLNEGNDIKRSRKLPPSPPEEKQFNSEDSDTEQLQAPSPSTTPPKKSSLNFTAKKPNSTKKSKAKTTNVSKKQKQKDKAEGSAKITSFFPKSES
ncbi:hypothetical protein C2G38_2254495 [Gigaspora rosea]|uniref:DUF159-domain-containing protein n=1 Tax=Gigaspora rosea TaxID=44941 RepID=A0A397U1X8_9GLOM|nr:hypothetical protein C2G38_2254495 [Gigaspora rosea]